MAPKHLFFFLLTSLFLLIGTGCEKNNSHPKDPVDLLPTATMTGANTFGCLLNGEVWINSSGGLLGDNLDADYGAVHDILNISAQNTAGEIFQGIGMSAILPDIGTYPFNHVNYGNRLAPCSRNFIEQDVPLDENNFLQITRLDLQEGIVSGRFAFVLVDELCGDTLRFTDGRFDLLL